MPPQVRERQEKVRTFPGYGIVYPDGLTGVKVVRTYVEAPKRMFNPDGSKYYSTPPPLIHELYTPDRDEKGNPKCGGFAYADGSPVRFRQHLEIISEPNMRSRGLEWFDNEGVLSEKATEGVAPLNQEELSKKKPDPLFILSSDPNLAEKPNGLVKEIDRAGTTNEGSNVMEKLMQTLVGIDQRLTSIEKTQRNVGKAHKKQAVSMKERWADPDFRKTQLAKIKASHMKAKAEREEAANVVAKAGEEM